MNIRPFRHILINNDTGVTKTLEVSPIEWADLTINHYRHEEYKSVLYKETLNQRFPKVGNESEDKGGFWFLKSAYDNKGVKANVTYNRQVLNDQTNFYDDDFEGIVDFSSDGGWSIENNWIDVLIIDSRKLARFLSRDELEVNVFNTVSLDDVSVPDFSTSYQEATFKKVDLPLQCISNGYFFGTEVTEMSFGSITDYLLFNYRGETTRNEVGDRVSINDPAIDGTIYTNTEELKQDAKLTSIAVPFDLNFSLVFTIISGGPVTYNYTVGFLFRVFDSADAQIYENLAIITSGSGNTSQTIPINESGIAFLLLTPEVDVPSGGRVEFYFCIRINPFAPLFSYTLQALADINGLTSYVRVTNFNFYEDTDGWPDNQIRGFYASEMANRFIQLLTSETDTSKLVYAPVLGKSDSEFTSYPTTGYFGRSFTTCVYQIRQFIDRALNVSFRDWFKSLSADNPIGLWYNKVQDYFEIGLIDDFWKDEISSVSLGNVKDLKITPFTQYYFNKILSGEPKIEIEDYQGINEIHTETEHSTSIETKSNYDARSPYSRSTVLMEISRRKNISKFASLDTKSDDKICIVELNNSNETIQGGLSNLSGFKGVEQYYNLTKTPRQNLKRQQKLINAPLFKEPSESFKFLKSVKDTNISYLDGTIINELDDIPQSLTRLFNPEVYEFTGLYTKAVRDDILNDPHKAYSFIDKDGNTKYGYILSIEGRVYKQEGIYKLIAANTDRL